MLLPLRAPTVEQAETPAAEEDESPRGEQDKTNSDVAEEGTD